MAIRKNSSTSENLPDNTGSERLTDRNTEQERLSEEDDLDTTEVANTIEEGDEDYDDEELANELELDEEDLEDEDEDEKIV